MTPAPDTDTTRRVLAQRLHALSLAGVTHLPRPDAAALRTPEIAAPPSIQSSASPSAPVVAPAATLLEPTVAALPISSTPADKLTQLADLRIEVAACTRCQELACSRRQTVFGVGDPHARLCFVGEAPGADEDRVGEPFVGAAGQLLTDIITKGCKMRREDVYICNVLKCRPPGNRNPNPDEVDNCRGYLEQQLDLIRPEFICCLGRFAAQTLLGTMASVGKLRGTIHRYHWAQVVVTYHPSYLLRTPEAKRDTWQDIQMLLAAMGQPVS